MTADRKPEEDDGIEAALRTAYQRGLREGREQAIDVLCDMAGDEQLDILKLTRAIRAFSPKEE